MKRSVVTFCMMLPLAGGGCAMDSASFKGPHADMTEKYPRKPFSVQRKHPELALQGPHFIMPPGIPPLPEPAAASVQRPIRGSGENGPPPAYPSLTDTEASYGK